MTHQEVLHEVGLLVLGGTAIHLLQTAPLADQFKKLASIGIGFVTLLTMAGVAGLV